MTESQDACEDLSIEVSAVVVSMQWTKKDEGRINNKLFDGHYFCMCYNRYLHRLYVQAVLITVIVKNSILATDIIADTIVSLHL